MKKNKKLNLTNVFIAEMIITLVAFAGIYFSVKTIADVKPFGECNGLCPYIWCNNCYYTTLSIVFVTIVIVMGYLCVMHMFHKALNKALR